MKRLYIHSVYSFRVYILYVMHVYILVHQTVLFYFRLLFHTGHLERRKCELASGEHDIVREQESRGSLFSLLKERKQA